MSSYILVEKQFKIKGKTDQYLYENAHILEKFSLLKLFPTFFLNLFNGHCTGSEKQKIWPKDEVLVYNMNYLLI